METIKRWSSNFLQCLVSRKMKTLEEEQQSDDQVAILLPSDIMEDIISRLPVKSILRFRSVSKPWLSLISNPSFTTHQLALANNNNHRTTFFITAADTSTSKRYFLSAPLDGGSVTHLMTLRARDRQSIVTEVEHLNGLLCCIFGNGCFSRKEHFVANPSTRNFFKLPDPTTSGYENVDYFFGFDEARNEHKILGIPGDKLDARSSNTAEVMIFSMSNHSWRKINATIDISSIRCFQIASSVCVNSTIYLMVLAEVQIWAFDLRTEKFSTVNIPDKADCKRAYLIKINGCVGVVSYKNVMRTNKMRIWMLQDYENNVWVKETIRFSEDWAGLGRTYPLDSVNADEILFSVRKLSRSVIGAHIYNVKSGCFRLIQFTLDHPFLCKNTVQFHQINCYIESIMPL